MSDPRTDAEAALKAGDPAHGAQAPDGGGQGQARRRQAAHLPGAAALRASASGNARTPSSTSSPTWTARRSAMRETVGHAIRCELMRAKVFAGQRTPMVFGQPDEWLALLIESLLQKGQGDAALADDLAARAFDAAPEVVRQARRPGVQLDRRRRFPARPGDRGLRQRSLLLGPVLAAVEGRLRSAGRPARLRLDAGAADVLQRRRDRRAGADALSRAPSRAATARSASRARPSGRTPATTAGSASASASSPPTWASTISWPCAASSSTTCPSLPRRHSGRAHRPRNDSSRPCSIG